MHEYVTCGEALWTFNISRQLWQHRPTTGPAPPPAMAIAVTVVNGFVYVLTNQAGDDGEEDHQAKMLVFELDMQAWHWRLLPSQGQVPKCVSKITPVKVQVCT